MRMKKGYDQGKKEGNLKHLLRNGVGSKWSSSSVFFGVEISFSYEQPCFPTRRYGIDACLCFVCAGYIMDVTCYKHTPINAQRILSGLNMRRLRRRVALIELYWLQMVLYTRWRSIS